MEVESEYFRKSMLNVLNAPRNLAKGTSFLDCPLVDLVRGLAKEIEELRAACRARGPADIMDEAVDAANIAFLIWVRMRRLDDRDVTHTPECVSCPACLLERELNDAGEG